MTFDEAKAIVDRCTYKDGYTFYLHEEFGQVRIGLSTKLLPDVAGSYSAGVNISFELKVNLFYLTSEHSLLVVMEELILRLEKHEAYEWFKFDGKQVYNPHACV